MPSLKSAPGKDVIEVGQQFYIRASSSLADDRTRVLLNNDTFAVFDRGGDIQPVGFGQQGIFHKETRHLSRFETHFCGERPLLLSSVIREDNVLFGVDLTNPDLVMPSGVTLPRGTLHIYRTKFLTERVAYDQITLHNYGDVTIDGDLSFDFEADFADIFEVRGQKRARRGETLPEVVDRSSVTLEYEGLDRIRRITRVECSAGACTTHDGGMSVPVHLEPQAETGFTLTIECRREERDFQPAPYEEALQRMSHERSTNPIADVDISTSNEQFN